MCDTELVEAYTVMINDIEGEVCIDCFELLEFFITKKGVR